MKSSIKILFVILILLGGSQNIQSQEIAESIHLEGPRLGFTLLPASNAKAINDAFDNANVSREAMESGMMITQFGWQFEERFVQFNSGGCLVLETVLLAGGLERNMFLPSASFVIGTRNPQGIEFGMGPNFSLAGTGMAFAFGVTKIQENAFFPINLAVVTGNNGARVSLLVGFNSRRK